MMISDGAGRVDVYRDIRHPERFLTVPEGVLPKEALARPFAVQVLDYLLFAAGVRLGATPGLRCDVAAVRAALDADGCALHGGLAAMSPEPPAPCEPAGEAAALEGRAQALRARAAAWRRQLDAHGEDWAGRCHTLAAVLAIEARAEGLEARAGEAALRGGWAA